MRLTRIALVALAGLLLLADATAAFAKSYSADRFDVHIRVLPGGDLEIVETVVFRFETGTFDHVYREISSRRTDGIEIVSASMDGRPFPPGDGVYQIEVKKRPRTRVQWRFQPTADSAHTFVLTYIARGVAQEGPAGDLVAWRALPDDHQYRIASATVEVELPAGAPRPLSTPRFTWRRIDGPVDAGHQHAEQDTSPASTIRTTARDIRANGWIEAEFDLPAHSILTAPPAWQQRAIAARAAAPRFVLAAALLLFAGLVGLFWVRQQYDAPPRDVQVPAPSPAVPDTLAPALVGAVLSNGSTTLEHAMATLFSLAASGVVSIEEQPRGRLGQHHFLVRRKRTPPTLAAHEQALLALAFDDGKENSGASLTSVRSRIARRFRNFREAVQQDLTSAGLLDWDRKRIRDRYLRTGVFLMLLGGVALSAAAAFVSTYQGWPLMIPGAIVLVGFAALICAAATTPLSNEGVRRGARWRGFRGYLKAVSHDHETTGWADVEALLPLAVASGLTYSWAKFLKRHPGRVPAWFQAVSSASQDSAFTAFVASSGGAHGGGGAGAGAGAAGGGSSGAG